jgi:hypothetical protein
MSSAAIGPPRCSSSLPVERCLAIDTTSPYVRLPSIVTAWERMVQPVDPVQAPQQTQPRRPLARPLSPEALPETTPERPSARLRHDGAVCGVSLDPTPPPHHRYVDGVGSSMFGVTEMG